MNNSVYQHKYQFSASPISIVHDNRNRDTINLKNKITPTPNFKIFNKYHLPLHDILVFLQEYVQEGNKA